MLEQFLMKYGWAGKSIHTLYVHIHNFYHFIKNNVLSQKGRILTYLNIC